jgi:N-acetylmuramoyl-L-alanine amidase
MPGALLEPLYITDPFEASLATSGLGQEVIADGLATAIEGYFGAVGPDGGSVRSPSSSAP